ncbi:MAG: AAA family ATPase [Euryarchaeota archaeon]|nr:AAA family ATPase [Euryarchaeota archaeon]
MIIAVSGKGGTGKTVIASLLVRSLAERNAYDILAIDSDPDSNLPDALGVEVERTIGDIREELLEKRDSLPPGVSWRSQLEYEVMRALVETESFDLLSMGRPEGPGCYCAANHVLREIIDTMAGNYDYVIIDTEAGLEHLSRRTTQNVDVMLVVTDTSKRGITTAARIKELAEELNIKFDSIYVVINRATAGTEEKLQEYAGEVGLEVIGTVPEDENVRMYDHEGRPLMELPGDTPALRAVRGIAEKIVR